MKESTVTLDRRPPKRIVCVLCQKKFLRHQYAGHKCNIVPVRKRRSVPDLPFYVRPT
jgi:hypothetical protein